MSDYDDYDYDDNDNYDDNDQPDDGDVEVENAFYEAEDKKNSNPKEALEGFETVILLEDSMDSREWTFKALLAIITIKCKQELFDGLTDKVS
mmetsp:Transcript_1684/g.2519  ORF Transcript_1684/g.2519 Transcript_1684/m.2519 type:complete len:92 (-) Transcript_1684:325-600(-)